MPTLFWMLSWILFWISWSLARSSTSASVRPAWSRAFTYSAWVLNCDLICCSDCWTCVSVKLRPCLLASPTIQAIWSAVCIAWSLICLYCGSLGCGTVC